LIRDNQRAAGLDAGGVECVYDVRVVWAFEAQERAFVDAIPGELGIAFF